jgi:hypothetical protein
VTEDWNFSIERGFQPELELSMQAIVDKVMRAFTFKQPVSDEEARLVRHEVTEFAAELLDHYTNRLAHRNRRR